MARRPTVKYYTPSIEEFHVGFEYEISDWWTLTSKDNHFVKRTLKKSWLWPQSMTNPKENEHFKAIIKDEEYNPTIGPDYRHEWERITTGIKDGTVRVKILDADDFLELGFEELAMPEGMEGDNYFKLTENGYMYSIWKEEDRYVITISDENRLDDSILFYGRIRNKSELSKILNQVKWT